MKRFFAIFLLFLIAGFGGFAQVSQTGTIKWSVNPFEHALFVENKGQFDTVLPGEQILFEAKLGGINAFFTAKGILYRHIETEKLDFSNGKDPDQDGPPKRSFYYLTAEWEGANANVTVDADVQQSYNYTYPKGMKDTYIAHVFKKITYHNLYPGIDVVYSFNANSQLEYSIVVHPGANLNEVHLKYNKSAGMKVDAQGNVIVKNDIGILKESAPVGYYMEDHNPVDVFSALDISGESFIAKNLDASKTLMIDPAIQWTTNPGFTSSSGYDYAYDLDYDNAGNIYVYGSGPHPLQLVKLNPAGVIQWTFNATLMTSASPYYGDFAVDKHSEECYIVEGWHSFNLPARIEKISAGGSLMGTDPGNSSFNEMWRIVNSVCPPAFEIFGGGVQYPDQAAMLDTTMTTINPVNILGASVTTGFHDMALCAADPMGGSAWTATTQSLYNIPVFNNYLVKCPVPALAPSAYAVKDGFAFLEINSIFYTPAMVYNSMNGMACSALWLYMYNGDTLKQINKTTGALNAVTKISATPYRWGGLDVDLCENIYVGNATTIDIYNSSLAMTSTLPALPDTIYDLAIAPYQSQLVYACGQNFVSSISLGPPIKPISFTKVPTNCSACNGSATATLTLCGIPVTTGRTYKWSNGQTTSTATSLCKGIDTVTITVGCSAAVYTDTVTIPDLSGLTIIRDSANSTCVVKGNAAIMVSGGNPPYKYDWSNGSTNSSTGPVGAGVYCVGVKDKNGCSDSLCITVTGTPNPTITISPNPDTICSGAPAKLTATATGNGPFSYVWSTGANTSSISVSPASNTSYTVVGTDVNGCSNKDSVLVDVIPSPVVTITAPSNTICTGGSVVLTASGANTYSWQSGASSSSISVTPSVTTTYIVSGTDAQGCKGTATFEVVVNAAPVLMISPNQSICQGKTVTLNAIETSGSPGTYNWQPGNSSGPSITVTPDTTTTYAIQFTNTCGSITGNVTVSVNPLPVPSFKAGITQGCTPFCTQFRDLSTVNSDKITMWAWNFGDGDTSNAENPIYCYPDTGAFNVILTVTSDSGCSATLKILNMINVFGNPVAAFTYTPQLITILQPAIQFINKSTDPYGIAYWFWSFGDNNADSVSQPENPTHTYQDTGVYCVRLVAMNIHGCTDTTINCLVINPIFALYIPDAFSPNGDGINDIFLPKGNDIKTFEMYIFDRWGMQLFHSIDITNGWNGKVNGNNSVCEEDTYVYDITVTDNKNIRHTYIGQVNLIK